MSLMKALSEKVNFFTCAIFMPESFLAPFSCLTNPHLSFRSKHKCHILPVKVI